MKKIVKILFFLFSIISYAQAAGVVNTITTTPTTYTGNDSYDSTLGIVLVMPQTPYAYRIEVISNKANALILMEFKNNPTTSANPGRPTPHHRNGAIVLESTFGTTESRYFGITLSDATESITVSYKPQMVLATETSGSGTISYSNSTLASLTSSDLSIGTSYTGKPHAGDVLNITASASAGYKFSQWSVSEGSKIINGCTSVVPFGKPDPCAINATNPCVLSNPTQANTTLQMNGNCNLQATFVKGTVYTITGTETSYTVNKNYFNEDNRNKVRFKFTAPSAAKYRINISSSANQTVYQYSSSDFSGTPTTKCTSKTSCDITFDASANDVKYFEVETVNSSEYSTPFTIGYKRMPVLTFVTEGEGTAKLSTSGFKALGESVNLKASAASGYKFYEWSVTSGSCTLSDPGSLIPQLTLNSDCTVKATFVKGTVYNITTAEKSYSTNNNKFSDTEPGVRFKFAAPKLGTFRININSSVNRNVYQYSNADFSDEPTTICNSETNCSFTFAAIGSSTKYFEVDVVNSGHYDRPFTISYTPSINLSFITSANGSVESVNLPSFVGIGDLVNIKATPNAGYKFDHWNVSQGSCTVTDPIASTTTIKMTGDCSISATFIPYPIYDITETETSYTVNKNYFNEDNRNKVRFKFTAPEQAYFRINFKSNAIQNVKRYINDDFSDNEPKNICSAQNNCSDIISSRSTYYFEVEITNSSDYNEAFTINYEKLLKLEIYTLNGNPRISVKNNNTLESTTSLSAQEEDGYVFDRWLVTSGTCIITDSNSQKTSIKMNSDCVVNGIFLLGTTYDITTTPTEFSFNKNSYDKNNRKIIFRFTAPQTNFYTLKSSAPSTSIQYSRDSQSFERFHSDYFYLKEGEDILFLFTLNVNDFFYVMRDFDVYCQETTKLKIMDDGHGSGFITEHYSGTNLYKEISASPKRGYSFNHWSVISGNCTISKPDTITTTIKMDGECTIKANFAAGTIYALSETPKTYNYKTNKIGSYTYEVAFKWTSPSTGLHYIEITPLANKAFLYTFEGDYYDQIAEMNTVQANIPSRFYFLGDGKTHYWSVADSSFSDPNKNFSILVGKADESAILSIESTTQGIVYPKNSTLVAANVETPITATPLNGHVFKKWENISGECTITNPNNAETTITVKTDNMCRIKAIFEEMQSITPSLTINSLDSSNLPTMCTDVSVKDETTAEDILGLGETSFTLTLNDEPTTFQINSLQNVMQNSVAIVLVVDESGSMLEKSKNSSKTKLQLAQEAMTEFVTTMHSNNQIGIVGFSGGTSANIRQELTSNKSVLIQAIKNLKANGGTNINTGTMLGVTQIMKFPGKKAIIVFSDGENQTESTTHSEVTTLANEADVTIYSINIGSTQANPLKYLAETTGGTYTYIEDADELGKIFSTLQSQITQNATYSICFDTPDGVMNGEDYNIAIDVEFAGKHSSASIDWQEPKWYALDAPDIIDLKDASSTSGDILRASTQLQLTLMTEEFFDENYTQVVNISCLASGDDESFTLTNMGNGFFEYENIIEKMEGPATNGNKIVECARRDTLVTEFTDPAYKTVTRDTIIIGDDIQPAYYFRTASTFPSLLSDTLNIPNTSFMLLIDAESESMFKVDTLDILLYTDSGDSLWVKAAETDIYSSVFKVTSDFHFMNMASELKKDRLDALVNTKSDTSRVAIYVHSDKLEFENAKPLVIWINYKDENDVIELKDIANETGNITRATEKLKIVLNTQEYFDEGYTQKVNVSCALAGDFETFTLVNKGAGVFETEEPINKLESVGTAGNGFLECTSRDKIVTTFLDSMYKKITRDTISLDDRIPSSYEVMTPDFAKALDSINDINASFGIRISATTGSATKVDTLDIALYTDTKDTLWVKAIETGVQTSTFEAKGDFRFVNMPSELAKEKLDAAIDTKAKVSRVAIRVDSDLLKFIDPDSMVVWKQYEDVNDKVELKDIASESGKVTRATDKLKLALNTQEFFDKNITQSVKVTCPASGDEETFTLESTGNGIFEYGEIIQKKEGAATQGNKILECTAKDKIVSEFIDPMYKTASYDTVSLDDGVQNTYKFMTTDFANAKDSVNGISTNFGIRITATSESMIKVDTLDIAFVTSNDTVWVKAIETDVYSSTFEAKGDFSFVNLSSELKKEKLDAALDTKSNTSRVAIRAISKNLKFTKTDSLIVWKDFKDEEDVIELVDAVNDTNKITRSTDKLKLALNTQEFFDKNITQSVKVTCSASADAETFTLANTGKGRFELASLIAKNDGKAKAGNNALECAPVDTIIAEFTDPMYKKVTRKSIAFGDTVKTEYQFLVSDFSADLDSINTYNVSFGIRVNAISPTIAKADTIRVQLFADNGDSVVVNAVETGAYTSVFEGKATFNFVAEKSSMKKNALDALLDLDSTFNRSVIRARIDSDNAPLKNRDSLVVWNTYIPADSAEIYDKNLDGRADFVRIHFKSSIKEESISIDSVLWNYVKVGGKKAEFKDITIDNKYRWIEAEMANPFEYGITADSSDGYVEISRATYKVSQKVPLADKIGAVPVSVQKIPGKVSGGDFMNDKDDIRLDTLIVKFSEPVSIKKKEAWGQMLYYAPKCEIDDAKHLYMASEPAVSDSGTTWKFALPNALNIKVDDCVMTNPKAAYTDKFKNAPGIGGAKVEGENGDKYLYEIAAAPAVAGIRNKVKWISPKTHEWESIPDTISCLRTATREPYKVEISIFDAVGQIVSDMSEKFGYNGEFDDKIYANDENSTKTNFLCWDQRSRDNRKVGTGVYIWKTIFNFEDGHKETRIIKSGIKRKN